MRARAAWVRAASKGAGSKSTQQQHETSQAACIGGNKFAQYLEYFRGELPLGQLAPHLDLGAVHDTRHRICLSRFRCSAHHLRVERDRYLPEAIKPPRHLRTCLFCCSASVEDEHHFIFHCALYSSLRFEYADLFSTDCLREFLSQPNQDRVAQFVHACSKLRSQTTL